jgi:hypothetical protein
VNRWCDERFDEPSSGDLHRAARRIAAAELFVTAPALAVARA